MGQLIPAGTGYREVTQVRLRANLPQDVEAEEAAALEQEPAQAGVATKQESIAAQKTAAAKRVLDL